MRRPLWTYRPLLCLLGLHDERIRPARTWVQVGEFHHHAYRVIAECRRLCCTHVTEVARPVIVTDEDRAAATARPGSETPPIT